MELKINAYHMSLPST